MLTRRIGIHGYLQEFSSSYLQRRLVHTSTYLQKVPNNLKGKSQSSQEWLSRHLNDPYVKRARELNYRARSAFKLIEIDDKAKILKPGQIVVECGAAPGAWTQVIVKRINSDGRVSKKRTGTVIGIDLLPIAPLEGAIFLGGCDFTSASTLNKIREILWKRKAISEGDKRDHPGKSTSSAIDKNHLELSSESESAKETKCDDSNLSKQDSGIDQNDKFLVDVILSDMAPNATGQRDTDHPRIVQLVEKALEFAVENGRLGGHFLTKIWDGSETKRLENCIATYYDKVSRIKPPCSRNDSSELFILGKYKIK